MFTAIIYQDSPQLPKMRALLSKQRLQWDEETTLEPIYKLDCWTRKLEPTDENKPAVKITVTNTRDKMQVVRSKPKQRKKPVNDTYSSEKVGEGVYLWNTPTGIKKASFAYDAKALERIKKETQARIDASLKVKTEVNWKE